ncbi:MAG: hypothetical protein EHM55_15665 [Acidobacteria bacterium]|nr:MAG: hypothetical protein EHM55_15665 [Acidobacteriota bacterium]
MDDERLVAAFETGVLAADEFTHAQHVRVAWWYLKRHSFDDATARFKTGLQRFVAAHGASAKYHETMTVAYLRLIAHRLHEGADLAWPDFAAQNADLLSRSSSILTRHYTEERLQSGQAKRVFLHPDRHPFPD